MSTKAKAAIIGTALAALAAGGGITYAAVGKPAQPVQQVRTVSDASTPTASPSVSVSPSASPSDAPAASPAPVASPVKQDPQPKQETTVTQPQQPAAQQQVTQPSDDGTIHAGDPSLAVDAHGNPPVAPPAPQPLDTDSVATATGGCSQGCPDPGNPPTD